MVWTQPDVTREILLPSNGTQEAGSGAIYIGPNLPAELVARGATSGIVWWSQGAAPDYKYAFIASFPPPAIIIEPGVASTTRSGAVDLAGNFLPEFGVLGNELRLVKNALAARWFNNGIKSYITDVSGSVDTWLFRSSQITIPGVATYTIKEQWRVSYDRMVDYRVELTVIQGAWTTLLFTSHTVDPSIAPTGGSGVNGINRVFLTGLGLGTSYQQMLALLDGPAGNMQLLNPGNSNNTTVVQLSGTWAVDK